MKTRLDEDLLLAYLKDECNRAGGQKEWAAKANVSVQYVSDVIHSRRKPGKAIYSALGYEKRVEYVRVAP